MPMLKQIFKDKEHLARQLEMPMLKERESYLEAIGQRCQAQSTLLVRACYLPHIISFLKLDDGSSRRIPLNEIDSSAEKWSLFDRKGRNRNSPSTKKLFTQIAIEFLIHINRMDEKYMRVKVACGKLHLSGSIRKYYDAPLFTERISYLEYLRDNGYTDGMVRKAAIFQLHAIDHLNLLDKRTVSRAEIEGAAQKWSKAENAAKNKVPGSEHSVRKFIWDVTCWLKYLNIYELDDERIPWSYVLTSYLDYITEETGGSLETKKVRFHMIRKFLTYVESQGSSPAKLSLRLVDGYLSEIADDGCHNRTTCANIATGLRSFIKYLEQKQWCPQGLSAGIRSPRQYKLATLPSSPDWNIVREIVTSKNTDKPIDIRNHAILMLLSVYSLRCGEVLNLRLRDLDWRSETIRVNRTKTGMSQSYPLEREVGDAIILYLKTVRPNYVKSDYVFLSMRAPYRRMSNGAVYEFVSEDLKKRGLELDHYGPHTIRKAGATHMINNGVGLKTISAHLGHQQLDTTRIYAKVNLASLRKVADIDWSEVLS